MYLALASANRDETFFDDPDAIRPDRNPSDVFTFGHGRHSCIGASWSRFALGAFGRDAGTSRR